MGEGLGLDLRRGLVAGTQEVRGRVKERAREREREKGRGRRRGAAVLC